MMKPRGQLLEQCHHQYHVMATATSDIIWTSFCLQRMLPTWITSEEDGSELLEKLRLDLKHLPCICWTCVVPIVLFQMLKKICEMCSIQGLKNCTKSKILGRVSGDNVMDNLIKIT